MPANPFDTSDEICDAVQEFLDTALLGWPNADGETFIFCRVCGEIDSHTDGCFVPAVLRWQRSGI